MKELLVSLSMFFGPGNGKIIHPDDVVGMRVSKGHVEIEGVVRKVRDVRVCPISLKRALCVQVGEDLITLDSDNAVRFQAAYYR